MILDPRLTRHTPERLWLSSGLRAVDHAVESIGSKAAQPLVDAACLASLRMLGRSLVENRRNPEDLDQRLESQLGTWLACIGINSVPLGASHGLGHVLGARAGVPHGMTSCILMPAVLRYNAPVAAEQQDRIAQALEGDDAVSAVTALIDALGLPRRLRELRRGPAELSGACRASSGEPARRALAQPAALWKTCG